MRVITGTARGKKLNTPAGEDTRPTASRVKEGLFSAIQFDIEGRRVLDLFAGSGQLGIEALSRGAERAVFTDSSADAVEVIIGNLKNTGLFQKASVARTDSVAFLQGCRDEFDIIFLDPPYRAGIYGQVLPLCAKRLGIGGMIICEYPTDIEAPQAPDGTDEYRSYRYGNTRVTIFKRTGEDND